jgi:hypothetical protein
MRKSSAEPSGESGLEASSEGEAGVLDWTGEGGKVEGGGELYEGGRGGGGGVRGFLFTEELSCRGGNHGKEVAPGGEGGEDGGEGDHDL